MTHSCLNLLIDFSNAFDTISHDILLRKFQLYGVLGEALLWISSYLKNRKQSVYIGGKFSDTKVTNISVPQGSVLGPLLFLIYINELPSVSRIFAPTMFADDCTLNVIGSNIQDIIADCNTELASFKSWADANRLSINIDKTKCLFSSNIHSYDLNGSIILNGHEFGICDLF